MFDFRYWVGQQPGLERFAQHDETDLMSDEEFLGFLQKQGLSVLLLSTLWDTWSSLRRAVDGLNGF